MGRKRIFVQKKCVVCGRPFETCYSAKITHNDRCAQLRHSQTAKQSPRVIRDWRNSKSTDVVSTCIFILNNLPATTFELRSRLEQQLPSLPHDQPFVNNCLSRLRYRGDAIFDKQTCLWRKVSLL